MNSPPPKKSKEVTINLNQCPQLLLEPKEEPIEDYQVIPDDDQIIKEEDLLEPKEEPIDDFPVFPEYNQLSSLASKEDDIKEENLLEPIDAFPVIPEDSQLSPVNLQEDDMVFKEEDMLDDNVKAEMSEASMKLENSFYEAISNKTMDENFSLDDPTGEANVTAKEVDNSTDTLTTSSRKRKVNDSRLECPECNWFSYINNIRTWLTHLKQHNLTPAKAGLALLCECGQTTSTYYRHTVKCNISKFTVVSADLPGSIYDKKTTPQCTMCEAYPTSIRTYANHIHNDHKSTLIANGILLRCSCEFAVSSDASKGYMRSHAKKCNGRDFTLHKLSIPKCIFTCETYPKSLSGYVRHLRYQHKTTLKANGIFLKCSCGFVVRSENVYRNGDHDKNCKHCEFTLHKIDEN